MKYDTPDDLVLIYLAVMILMRSKSEASYTSIFKKLSKINRFCNSYSENIYPSATSCDLKWGFWKLLILYFLIQSNEYFSFIGNKALIKWQKTYLVKPSILTNVNMIEKYYILSQFYPFIHRQWILSDHRRRKEVLILIVSLQFRGGWTLPRIILNVQLSCALI